MSYKIEFLPRARKELLEAWDWYDDRWSGLGFRETKIGVFPYLIVYKLQKRKKIVAISSIFHTSKNPKKKYTGEK